MVEVHSQVMALQLLQLGVDDKLKLLQKNKDLEKSNLDLVRFLAAKTAQCEALAKKNSEPTEGEQRTKSPQQPAKERKANKNTLIIGSFITRDLKSTDKTTVVTGTSFLEAL